MLDNKLPPPTATGLRQPLRSALLLLVLAMTLAACKDVKPGSGVETIAKSRAQTSVSGR